MCRIYRKSDPRFQPHQFRDGKYQVHRRDMGMARNQTAYAMRVESTELVGLIRTLEWTVRMSIGGRGPSATLIAPKDIGIEELPSDRYPGGSYPAS